jgi:hypothetical protein
MTVLGIFGRSILLLVHLLKIWIWVIPTCLTILAIAGHFGLMYLVFDSVHVNEIKEYFGDNKWGYLFGFILPLALPMFIAFISAFAQGKGVESSLQQAMRFRNGQMRVKPPVEASKILRKTAFLDALNSEDSEVYEKARRGYDAQYGNSSPTKVYRDLMDDDA